MSADAGAAAAGAAAAGAAAGELIDVHTHVVPEHFPRYLGRHAGAPWPQMAAAADACHRHVMISGKVYRTVSHGCWSCQVRLADMQRSGVARQVLSPMPELLGPWLEPEDGLALARHLNDVVAAMVAEAPAHFIGLGAVPLQDVELAIAELDQVVHQRGLAGVELPSHVGGAALGEARFRPFFEAAAAWGAAVFVHPLRPSGLDRVVGPPALEQVVAFPGEIGLAGASLITSNLLAELPRLRVALSHGGGSLPTLLPRLAHGWRTLASLREVMPADPRATARRLFVDDLVYDAAALRRVIDVFGPQQVMAGTDYPFAIMDEDPAGSLQALHLDPATHAALRGGNARRWLGLDAGPAETP